ncbi:MAG TPA: fibronectin type III domain-containing protein [Kiritimatiellia bacterium]|nr:fibronectin type III domain-containing protein [Kiritimatiellia bacterium]
MRYIGGYWQGSTAGGQTAFFDNVYLKVTASATAPTVSTTAASSLGTTSATLGGDVTADGGATVTDRGVVYKTSSGVTIADNKTQIGSGVGVFSQSIGSLAVNTRYWFRAYAINSAGTTLGSELNFWTLANVPGQPTVGGATSSSLDVTIAANGNPASTEFSIRVGSQFVQASGALGASEVWQNAAAWGSPRTVTGLAPSTTYTFDVRARNGANTVTAWSASQNGTTSAGATVPVLTTPTATSITTGGATLGATITSDGSSTITSRGTVWGTSANPTGNVLAEGGTAVSPFSHARSGMGVNTLIYYRGYAVNGIGTGYSSDGTFWTLANVPSAPTVSSPTATTLDVVVNVNGNPAITEFAIRTGGQYVQADGSLGATEVWQTAATWGTRTVSGLASGTTHSFDVKARNGAGTETAFSSTASGLTLPGQTATPTAASITPTGFTVNWAPTTGAASYRLDVATDSGFTAMVSGFNNLTVSGTSQAVSGLTPGQTYYVRVRAVNASGTGANSGTLTQAADCFDDVVTGLTASAINSSDFTASWNALAGATGYLLDVSTNDQFSGVTVSDDFTDGNFTANPVWSGDTSDFVVDTSGTLPSGNASTDGSFLAAIANVGNAALTTPSTEVNEWRFSLGSPNFDPSGVNHFGVILMSDTALSGDITTASWDGYYLRLGVNGGTDYLELWRSSGATKTKIGDFTAAGDFGTGALRDGLELRITRDGSGEFELFYATGFTYASTPTTSGGTLTDSTHTSASFFGVYARFANPATTRRVYIDNIELGGSASFVDGYEQREVAGTSHTVTGLLPGVTYYFRVVATNAYCATDPSTTEEVTTTAPDLIGPTPTDLLVNDLVSIMDNTLSGGVDLTVTWQDSNSGLATTPAPSFTLYYPDGATESGNFTAGYTAGVTTPVVVTNAAALDVMNWIPGTYTVLVSAVDMAGNDTIDEPFTFTVIDDDPDAPTIFEYTIDGMGISGTEIPAGGIAIVGVNGHPLTGDGGGDGESFAFVVLNPFPVGTEIFFTDAGWSNNAAIGWHRTSEFHRASWVSTGSEALGSVVTLTISNLNNGGDQVAVYQYDGMSDPLSDPDNVRFLYAITVRNDWYDPPVPNNNESSALYYGLTNGLTALSLPSASSMNVRYTGNRTGTAQQLLLAISNPTNWTVDPVQTDITDYGEDFNVLGPGDLPWDIPTLTDAQVNQGGYIVTNIAQDIDSGLLASNTVFSHAPYFVLYGTNDSVIVSNLFPAAFANGSTAPQIMSLAATPGAYDGIYLGFYSSVVAVADADNDRNNDSLTTRFGMQVLVVDDDPDPPQVGDDLVAVMIDETALPPATGITALIAGWNFNASDTVVSHGAGSLSHNLINTPTFGNPGTTINAVSGDVAGQDITITGGPGLGNNGRYIQFVIDMSGLENLVMTYSTRRSGTGFDSQQLSYSTDGDTFTDFGAPFTPTLDNHALRTYDLSSVTDLNNQGEVYLRITLSGATFATGNNRFDNFQFNADISTIFEVTDAQLAAISGSNPFRFSFNIFDPGSGLVRGSTFNHTNMMMTLDGFVTNNTANYLSGLSSADSTIPTSTSLWQFTSFTYDQIGDLFADGLSNRPIRITAADADNDRPNDASWMSNRVIGTFRVIDDDEDPPMVVNVNYTGAAARPFMVLTNGLASPAGETIRGSQARRSGTGASTVFRVSDAELANAGTVGLQFAFGARDVLSGVARGAAGPDTNSVMSFSVGNTLIGNFSDYSAALSSDQTGPNQPLTNIWAFSNSSFDGDLINNLVAAGQQPVLVTIPDTDNDRPNDQATLFSHQVGFLQVIDDDIRGPIISSISVEGAFGPDAGFLETFEPATGWTNSLSFSGAWTWEASNGTYTAGGNVLWGSLDPKVSGTRRIGLLTNVAVTTSWLELPPVENPGNVTLFAGRFGAEGAANDVTLRMERRDGASWVNLGDQVVTNRSPEFEMFTWGVNVDGVVTLRLTRVTTTGPQVYVDDIAISPVAEWISTNQLAIAWSEAVDDFSGVDEYRIVVPAFTNTTLVATNSGVHRPFGVTNDTFSILGQQGVITGFVFAIDDDNDRPNDRSIGNLKSLIVRVDTNPPLPVVNVTNVMTGIDETSEIMVTWSPPAATEAQAAGWRQADSVALSPWDTYIIEVTELDATPLTTQKFTRAHAGYGALSNFNHGSFVLSNLNFDTEFRVAIRGRDEAGNIGPSITVTAMTERFSVTQGVNVVGRDIELFWTGPDTTNRNYDVLFVDSSQGFQNALSNQWDLMKTTNQPVVFDTGSVDRLAPRELTNGYFRFYRVAREGQWTTNNGTRRGSREIYVTRALPLRPGENWYSLFFVPDTNTVGYVFGTNLLAGGSTFLDAPKISWYNSEILNGQVMNVATMQVWLRDDKRWIYQIGGSFGGVADHALVPLQQAFNLEMPVNAGPTNLIMIGQVPTNNIVIANMQGALGTTNYHLISHSLPTRTRLADMNFFGSGLRTNHSPNPTAFVPALHGWPDEIRILNNTPVNGVGAGSQISPTRRFYMHGDGNFYDWTTRALANDALIDPYSTIVLIQRNHNGTITWTNRMTYTPPGRNFNP